MYIVLIFKGEFLSEEVVYNAPSGFAVAKNLKDNNSLRRRKALWFSEL